MVGASGSGKSLLAHAILGILPYNCRMEGKISYQGEVLDETRLAGLRGNGISLIPQGVSYLDPLMRVGDQTVSYTHLDVYKRQRLIWTSTVRVSPMYSYPQIWSRSCSLVNTWFGEDARK